MWERSVEVYTLDKYPLLISSAVTFFLGFWIYIWTFKIILTQNTSPIPFWMHTFYLAHDSTWAVRSLMGAAEHNWHWYLVGSSVALFGWTTLELISIYKCITHAEHRQEIWGLYRPLNKGPVTERDAWFSALKQTAGFYCCVNLAITFFASDAPMYDWFIFTNIVLAWGPNELWRRRPSRECVTVGYVMVTVLTSINSFAPWNMWALAFPDLYKTFWFSATGVVTLAINLANLKTIVDLPVKASKRGKLT